VASPAYEGTSLSVRASRTPELVRSASGPRFHPRRCQRMSANERELFVLECLEFALSFNDNALHGIWGGVGARGRRRARARGLSAAALLAELG